jgi:hypothetical protein
MPVLISRRARAALGAIVMASLGGCNHGNTREIVIGKHTFRVPEKYLVKGSIPWLPMSQHEGLMFVINPEARPQEQKIVTLGSTKTTCQPETQPTSNMLALACTASGDSKISPAANFTAKKVYPYKDVSFQWEYRANDKDGNSRTVASCTSIDNGKDGLCTSIGSYKDLVYSVGLRDSEVQHLPEIWAKVREMLVSWEASPVASE